MLHFCRPFGAPPCLILLSVLAGATSCAGRTPTPKEQLSRYAEALEKGELEKAWALAPEEQRREEGFAAFRARHSEAAARTAVGARLRAATSLQAACARVFEAPEGFTIDDRGCTAPAVKAPTPADVLTQFIDAAEARRFAEAWPLLSADWRRRYTAERLAADFDKEPQVKERLARARLALAAQPFVLTRDGAEARLPIGEGIAVTLLREDGTYKVASLE